MRDENAEVVEIGKLKGGNIVEHDGVLTRSFWLEYTVQDSRGRTHSVRDNLKLRKEKATGATWEVTDSVTEIDHK